MALYFGNRMITDCDGCGETVTLTTIDSDGVLIGDECPQCEYYTTRYMPGQSPVMDGHAYHHDTDNCRCPSTDLI